MLNKIKEKLMAAKKVAIFTHLNPDGDAFGSSFAMKYVLESVGVETAIWLEKEMPQKFAFLGTDYMVGNETTDTGADTALVLDCATFDRLGSLAEPCRKIETILCVDHHFSGEDFGTLCYKDSDAAATAQIVYRLAESINPDFPMIAAEAMFTGLSTDTGHFKFSNVKEETFRVAAALTARGLEHRKISQQLYDNVKHSKLVFMGKAAEKIEFYEDGKIAVLNCPESFLAEYGLTYDDVEELPNLANSIEGVQVSVLIKDKDEVSKRVSLRGKDILDLSRCAEEFGGGGHKNAAAFVAKGDINAVIKKLISIVTKGLEERNV
ncbi:MAG: bifunctional oligoribonuclease/PAP phosphatase NrnA [Clostridia bacterium]|nr:bifunctional oligoribonuclease/PAP phosphatase NrnA [Clostridia bacterium]